MLVAEIALEIMDALFQPRPHGIVHLADGVSADVLGQLLAEGLVGEVVEGRADQRKLARQQLGLGEVVQRGDELALGQIAGRAEDDHQARVAGSARRTGGVGGEGAFGVHQCPPNS